MSSRNADWQKDLTSLIEFRMKTPYHIVNFNCLMWGCEASKTINGIDDYAPFRGKFNNELGAALSLKVIGLSNTLSDYLAKISGPKIHLAMLRKGDRVIAPIAEATGVNLFGNPIGVCYGRYTFFVGPNGLIRYETLSLGTEAYGFHS